MWVVIFQSWGCWSRRSWHVLVGNLHRSWGADISFRHFFLLIVIAQRQMGNSGARKYTACIEMCSWLWTETALKQSDVCFFIDTLLAYVTPTFSQPGQSCIKMVTSSMERRKFEIWIVVNLSRYRWMEEIVAIFESESFSTKIMEQLRGLLPPFPPRQVSI